MWCELIAEAKVEIIKKIKAMEVHEKQKKQV